MYVYGACLFYVCCSDCVGVCGNVCSIAAVVKFNRQFKAGQTYFFGRDPSSDEGNQKETIGDGANIHRGPSNESNPEL